VRTSAGAAESARLGGPQPACPVSCDAAGPNTGHALLDPSCAAAPHYPDTREVTSSGMAINKPIVTRYAGKNHILPRMMVAIGISGRSPLTM
jgi:hypothetical protein